MSGGLGTATANALLDLLFGGVAFTPDATVYIALDTVMFDAANAGGTECSAGNYARLAVTNNSGNFSAASGGSKTNAAALTWPAAATADWATAGAPVVGGRIMSAASGGVQRARFTLTTPKPILALDTPSLPAGIMAITLT